MADTAPSSFGAVFRVREFQALYVYTQSDEISVLLPQTFDLFDRSLEKVVSLTASLATAVFNRAFARDRGHPPGRYRHLARAA